MPSLLGIFRPNNLPLSHPSVSQGSLKYYLIGKVPQKFEFEGCGETGLVHPVSHRRGQSPFSKDLSWLFVLCALASFLVRVSARVALFVEHLSRLTMVTWHSMDVRQRMRACMNMVVNGSEEDLPFSKAYLTLALSQLICTRLPANSRRL